MFVVTRARSSPCPGCVSFVSFTRNSKEPFNKVDHNCGAVGQQIRTFAMSAFDPLRTFFSDKLLPSKLREDFEPADRPSARERSLIVAQSRASDRCTA
jgi:hypothetical protein